MERCSPTVEETEVSIYTDREGGMAEVSEAKGWDKLSCIPGTAT